MNEKRDPSKVDTPPTLDLSGGGRETDLPRPLSGLWIYPSRSGEHAFRIETSLVKNPSKDRPPLLGFIRVEVCRLQPFGLPTGPQIQGIQIGKASGIRRVPFP